MPAELKQGENGYLPEFCGNVINLFLMLQNLLTVSLKQQGGHTQAVVVEAFELDLKKKVRFIIHEKHSCRATGDVHFQ